MSLKKNNKNNLLVNIMRGIDQVSTYTLNDPLAHIFYINMT